MSEIDLNKIEEFTLLTALQNLDNQESLETNVKLVAEYIQMKIDGLVPLSNTNAVLDKLAELGLLNEEEAQALKE